MLEESQKTSQGGQCLGDAQEPEVSAMHMQEMELKGDFVRYLHAHERRKEAALMAEGSLQGHCQGIALVRESR